MTAPLRAAIYARFSTDMQRDASIDDQVRTCQDYAKRQGLEVVEVFSDKATSGASLMRSGIQNLLRSSAAGQFDVVISEALDRLSRNQADIASVYQKLEFQSVAIETVSEGSVSEMHIGLKGTMNSLFIKDLAAKTHRGLKGRALAGKSAGGKAYGYKSVVKLSADGEAIRGDRTIDAEEAKVVRRIFTDYANGISPKKIAEALNAEHIPGPSGRGWGASTLHGNRERGTGILNNELYIGRQIWNRLSYAKDPDTGKRISRLNPQDEWVISDLPELRLIDQPLWDAAKARQGALKTKNTGDNIWDRRRPRTLFSGLLKCSCCGGGFSKVSQTQFGCSTARNKGKALCTNRLTISQTDIETRVLGALKTNLMDRDLLEVFCKEYAIERNRLNAEAEQGRGALEKELATANRDHSKLVDAIIAGIPADQVRDKMQALSERQKTLEAELSRAPAPDPIRIHPKMALTYRDKVGAMIDQLGKAEDMAEAKDALRGLIDRIVLTPNATTGKLDIMLKGALSGLLALALGCKRTKGLSGDTQAIDNIEELVLVAGVGFEPTTFRL
ncbi:DNA invertase Pin-like site-specific DNA recombinase [Pacificibacter maritimus]|uniref:DNA invertase Pin-like site-specific DNA recombinase n=1 Tax=Pacificibacter maritimus TaxID=762213 RepID=A0A3N4UNF8_9RHOB|nr:recombinase family protein [Pacificibacter maritimus]RPE72196.1 DNA invertase Pin-like site-specific DNA recombinase [Pacificibacter maritimus]